ncbi:ionotropic receptor 75a [Diachasma alloeum]|uniref:Ionotropic receptor 64a.4 n=1 Tax=Diachasma alloeum TaxID=454923 RepID=A0A4E0RNY0_9HYME|nr:ionotropic receptor 75a [Diachasma alloeum]THK33136.1 ionotropic receptor 64a.4 [Diachasma alloeum]
MKVVALFLLAITLIKFTKSDKILAEFIRDYYGSCDIHQIVIFACWNYAADISQSVMGLDTVVTYQSTMNDVDVTTILRIAHFQVGVVLDFDCPFSKNILDKFSNQLHFNDSYYWLVLSRLTPISVNFLQHLRLTIEAELTFAVREGDTFKLHDVYNPSYRHGCDVVIVDKGKWSPGDGLSNKLTQYKYERRHLHGVTLNFTVTVANPVDVDIVTYLSSQKNRGLDPMQKSHYNLMLFLQYLYKFSITVYLSPLWGILVNGSYNGIMGDMVSNEGVDMSISPFEFDWYRLHVVEYVVPTWFTDFTFSFLHPTKSTMRNNFLKPFTQDLWWAILLVGAVYWVLLLLSLMLEQHHETGRQNINAGAVETGLTTVAALSQQGLSDSPHFPSGRITFLSLFLWALLLYQFYSASIVSSLITAPPRWIKSLKDLTESDLEVGAIDVSFFRDWFKITNNSDIRDLYNRKMNSSVSNWPNAFMSVPAGLKKVQEGGYAFLTETASTYRIMRETYSEDEICAVQEIRPQPRNKMSPILPKNSPFKKMITYGFTKIIQSGLLAHVQHYWRGSVPECPESYSSMPTAMGMKEFSPALFLLCIGAGISIVTLLIEYFHFYLEDQRDRATRHLEELPQ